MLRVLRLIVQKPRDPVSLPMPQYPPPPSSPNTPGRAPGKLDGWPERAQKEARSSEGTPLPLQAGKLSGHPRRSGAAAIYTYIIGINQQYIET